MVHFDNFTPVTDDKPLTSTYGGLFLVAGIGLVIKNGAVLDSSEILGIFVNKQFGFSIGKVVLHFNLIPFGITAISISFETAMYSYIDLPCNGKKYRFDYRRFRVLCRNYDCIRYNRKRTYKSN